MEYISHTLENLRTLEENNLYVMEYTADYRLDDFLRIGAVSDRGVTLFVEEYLLDGKPLDFSEPNFACSTFSARTAIGHPIFARNFDKEGCMKLVLFTRPKNGYASMSCVDMLYLGFETGAPITEENCHRLMSAPLIPMDGINEKGLAVGILLIRQPPTVQNRGNVGITTTTAVRMMLDKCASVKEAVEMLSQYDMYASAGVDFHFHVADRDGNSAVIEYVDHRMSVVERRYATNFLLTEGVNVGFGHDRYAVMEQAFAQNGGTFADCDAAMDLLRAVSADSTRWSAVYDQQRIALRLTTERAYGTPYDFTL